MLLAQSYYCFGFGSHDSLSAPMIVIVEFVLDMKKDELTLQWPNSLSILPFTSTWKLLENLVLGVFRATF